MRALAYSCLHRDAVESCPSCQGNARTATLKAIEWVAERLVSDLLPPPSPFSPSWTGSEHALIRDYVTKFNDDAKARALTNAWFLAVCIKRVRLLS